MICCVFSKCSAKGTRSRGGNRLDAMLGKFGDGDVRAGEESAARSHLWATVNEKCPPWYVLPPSIDFRSCSTEVGRSK